MRWAYVVKKFGDILRELVAESGMAQRAFADKAGLTQGTLSRLMTLEESSSCRPTTLQGLAAALGISVRDFLVEVVSRRGPSPTAIPDRIPGNFNIRFVSGVGADGGTDFEVDTWAKESVPGYLYPFPDHDPMAMRVHGTSMENANDGDSLANGDFVIFANALEEQIPDGELVIAHHPGLGAKVVKRLRRLPKGKIQLMPLNENEKPLPPMDESDVTLRAVKVVVRNRYKYPPKQAPKKRK